MQQYDFFVSYSKNIYNDFVKDFINTIKRYGINIWLDQINVHLGDEILSNLFYILDSFKNANYGVIIVFDSSFFEKKWCIMELEYIVKNKISFFPILFHIEKSNIPDKYKFLRNYNMVTIRDEKKDIENATNRILDIYIQRNDCQKICIGTFIFETLIRNYCDADKTNGLVVLSADNIGLYINIWHKNNHLFIDNYTNALITIIHSKLIKYYNCSCISDYDISLVCNATDKLICMYGSDFFTKI